MKTTHFVGSTREKAEADAKAWKLKNPGIREIGYTVSEHGTPAGKYAPKDQKKNLTVTITIEYED